MAGDLANGSIPPFYREVYEIACPNPDHQQVNQDLFLKILLKSSLPKPVITQIWEIVDEHQGFLTKNGLYNALALTALAQQGKAVGAQLLKDLAKGGELPIPNLGDLSDLKSQSVKVKREHNPNLLGYTYEELLNLETVKVQLVPEKKGIILKHVEYEVNSQKYRTTVHRRYNDFLAMHEFMLARFPYRVLPKLPPKKITTTREFIEQRRKSLQRYLNLIARHPSMCDDSILKFFLTYHGSETQNKMKDQFRGSLDEFVLSPVACKAKDIVPMDTVSQITTSKDHLRFLYGCVCKMKDAAERIVTRATEYAVDMQDFGRQLTLLHGDTTVVSTWGTGSSSTWRHLKRGFKTISQDYSTVADKAANEAAAVDDGVVQKLAYFQELLSAYLDLCDRHEKGVIQDHQRALQKMGQFKKRQTSVQTEEELQHRILEQESAISNMENRNYFSLHCLQLETQLVHSYMEMLGHMLRNMAETQSQAHHQLYEQGNGRTGCMSYQIACSLCAAPSVVMFSDEQNDIIIHMEMLGHMLRNMAETQSQAHHQLSQAWDMMRPSTENILPTTDSSPLQSPGSPSQTARQLTRMTSRE